MAITPASFKSFSIRLQIAFWSVLFCILVYITLSNTANLADAFARLFLVFGCHLIIFYACYNFMMPHFFEKKKYFLFAISILALLIVITPIRLIIEKHFAEVNLLANNFKTRRAAAFSLMLFSEVAIGGFACLVRLASTSYINQQIMESMRSMHIESELRFLKSQMSPHFLFNTINNIYSLTLLKSDKAPVFLLKLSSLLRYLLYECDKQVTYKQEEHALKMYADLFRLRYDEQLNLQISLLVQQQEKLMEPMLMIPILENAFKYSGLGINNSAFVKLSVNEIDGNLSIFCENSIEPTYTTEQPGGIGLNNIKKRLDMAYQDIYSLNFSQTTTVFTLKLEIPLV